MKSVEQIQEENNKVLKVIKGANGFVKEFKLVDKVKPKQKKVFPKTKSIIENKNCGLGTYKPPLFPLVKDEEGSIVIANTTYSRKRQHYGN